MSFKSYTMSIKREVPEVSAGSMADIAFLLLIFFLVTTTIETNVGLDRKLPSSSESSPVAEKNLLRVNLNATNELLVDGELLPIDQLRDKTISFLDNGGSIEGTSGYCSYCKGKGDIASSDNPQKAIISLSNKRETNYGVYIAVQNELVGAYNFLRNRESLRLYAVSYIELLDAYKNPEVSDAEKQDLKIRLKKIKDLFPQKISEVEINNN